MKLLMTKRVPNIYIILNIEVRVELSIPSNCIMMMIYMISYTQFKLKMNTEILHDPQIYCKVKSAHNA